jgi:hypothetical protein
MQQQDPKLSDILDYFANMSETLAEAALLNGLDALAHIYYMAALEARTLLKTARANEAATG